MKNIENELNVESLHYTSEFSQIYDCNCLELSPHQMQNHNHASISSYYIYMYHILYITISKVNTPKVTAVRTQNVPNPNKQHNPQYPTERNKQLN